jgi:four helix bundle protein
MSSITSFRDLLVWQKAVTLAVDCHQVARRFPREEQQVLGYQIRKSGVSIPSNIAEGFSRHSTAYYIQHLWMAHASEAELETQIEIARRVSIVNAHDAAALTTNAQEVARMINGLAGSLKTFHR